jgi:hypothetical protein
VSKSLIVGQLLNKIVFPNKIHGEPQTLIKASLNQIQKLLPDNVNETSTELTFENLLLLDVVNCRPVLSNAEVIDVFPELLPSDGVHLLEVVKVSDDSAESVVSADFREVDAIGMQQLTVFLLAV